MATENPLSPGYASKSGADFSKIDYVIEGSIKPNSKFIAGTAPGLNGNKGGAIEMVAEKGGVRIDSIYMLEE